MPVLATLAALVGACSFDATGNGSASPSDPSHGSSTGAGSSSTGDEPPTSTDVASTSTASSMSMSMSMAADPTTTEPVDPGTGASSDETGEDTGSSEGSSSGPPPPGCGNAVLEDDEECDDGNEADTDACTSACKFAVCGDEFVQANVEECDDGNANEADGCTSKCTMPTCSDGATNGSETDIDCGGGTCDKCELKGSCSTGNDCESGVCADICVHAPDCAALKSLGKPSGTYTIDPDGDGGAAPFPVWCEQDQAGGGWTLVLKIDGSKSTFVYADAKWTDPMAWMPDPDLDRTETKLQSFGSVQANEVLVGLEAPIQQGPLMLKYIQFNPMNDPPSLASIFMAGTHLGTTNAYSEWTSLVPVGSLQSNCRRQGFNAQADSNQQAYARVRIGIIGNNENDCTSPNSFLGVGASPEGDNCDGGYSTTTGNGAVCGADKGKQDVAGFAVVYVR